MTEALRLVSLLEDQAREQATDKYDHVSAMRNVQRKGPWSSLSVMSAFHHIQQQVPEGYKDLPEWLEWYEPTGNAVAAIYKATIKEMDK